MRDLFDLIVAARLGETDMPTAFDEQSIAQQIRAVVGPVDAEGSAELGGTIRRQRRVDSLHRL